MQRSPSGPPRVRAGILDPNDWPLIGGPDPAPPVPAQCLSAQALRARFAQTIEWTPDMHDDGVRGAAPGGATPPRESAVLIALIDRGPVPNVLFTVRATGLRHHAGQISFPGGRVDPVDVDAVHAALREADEEVGLPPAAVQVLGTLPGYVTGTGFVITPVIGLVDGRALDAVGLRLQTDEVAEAFEVPLDFLMNPQNHQRRRFTWQADGLSHERDFYLMPWQSDAYPIWGATAAIVRNLYRFLSTGPVSGRAA